MLRLVTLLCLAAATLGTPLKGVPHLDGRIVGGVDATIDRYPYQLSLLIAGNHECGAVIISEKWALTAAQCVGGSTLGMRLRAGTINRIPQPDEPEQYTIVRKIVHPNFNISTVDSDIALLEVYPPFKLEEGKVAFVNLVPAPDFSLAAGDPVSAAGWGNTHSGGLPSEILQEVEVNVVAAAECRIPYGDAAITDRMICAGVAEGGKDACQGDSGGPLVVKGTVAAEDLLVGIVSWGRGCALAAYPGVYTNVTAFLSWINTETTNLKS